MKLPDDERILIVRPCLKTICLDVRPAAKLLSLLLFYARNCSEQEVTYTFSCTQEDLIEGLIDEMDVKTLHRIAIPMLRLLGYLDVDGSSYRYQYTVHLDLIQHVLLHYKDRKQLDKILIVSMKWQLEKCLIQIDKSPIELVKCPIELDKLLIPFRQMSNSKRGRKPRPQVPLEDVSEEDRLLQIDSDITDKEESNGEQTDTLASPHVDALSLEEDEFPFALPDGDYIIIERLLSGSKKIRRASGRPIGELIPIGMDTSEGLRELITVNALTSSQNNENDSQSSPIADSNTTPSEGDDHASIPAPGYPHRMGNAPGADSDSHDAALEDTAALSPETRPVLEAGKKEIEGETDHAHALPPVPAENHPDRGSSEVPSGDSTLDSTGSPGALDAPSVDGAEGSDAVGGEGRAGVGEDTASGAGSGDAREADATGNTALGQLDESQQTPLFSSTVEPGHGVRDTVPVAPVPEQETPPAQGTDEKPKTPAPLSEPEMGGKWSDELCVQYAEWCNDKRYTDNMRAKQLNAAKAIHKDDKDLTLADFKQAYDERNDEWWQEHKKKLHVADMKAKGKSGIDRVHEMLQHIEDRATQGNRSKRHLRIVPTNAQPDDANMIEWKGQWMPKEEAYQQGYLGGWERYKGQLLPDGRHPLDDELPMQGMK